MAGSGKVVGVGMGETVTVVVDKETEGLCCDTVLNIVRFGIEDVVVVVVVLIDKAKDTVIIVAKEVEMVVIEAVERIEEVFVVVVVL